MNVAAYCRVSSDEQRENQSIQGQEEYIRAYCERQGWTITSWYLDDGVGGDLPFDQRPAGSRLLADAKSGAFAAVVVFLYDRFSRDVLVGLLAARTLRENGVVPLSCCEPFELGTPHGDYMFVQSLNNSQLWKAQFLQRIRAGIDRWSREGVWMGGITPFGYRVEGMKKQARLILDEEPLPGSTLSAVAVVRLMYRAVGQEGKTTFVVADQLNALGIPPSYVRDGRELRRGERKSSTAGTWSPGRVRNIIASTTYKGIHLYGKRSEREREIVERPVPAIVTPAEWQAAQDAMRRNQITSMRNSTRLYLLRGKLICQMCGQVLSGSYATRNAARGTTEFYYKCGGKTGYRGTKPGEDPHASCPGKSVPGQVEEWVWADIEAMIHNPGKLLSRLQEADTSGQVGREALQEELERSLVALAGKEAEVLRVARLHSKGVYSDAQAESILTQIAQEESTLRLEVARLEEHLRQGQAVAARIADTQELLTRLRGTIDAQTRRQVIELLVDRIEVRTLNPEAHPSKRCGELDVYYVFSDPKKLTGELMGGVGVGDPCTGNPTYNTAMRLCVTMEVKGRW